LNRLRSLFFFTQTIRAGTKQQQAEKTLLSMPNVLSRFPRRESEMMIKKTLVAFAAGVALFAAAAAHAQMGSHLSGEAVGMHKHQQHRMDKLKQSLKLSTDQDQAWAAFQGSMQQPAMQRPDNQAIAKMSTPERLEAMSKMKAQHDAQMEKRQQATLAFYGTLSAEQKKVFDQETSSFMNRHEKGGKHMVKSNHQH